MRHVSPGDRKAPRMIAPKLALAVACALVAVILMPARAWCPPRPAETNYYFAEGYTGAGFFEFLCLSSWHYSEQTIWVDFFGPGGLITSENYGLPKEGRVTINVADVVGPDKQISIKAHAFNLTGDQNTFMAERPLYFNYNGQWTGGSDVVGATSPAQDWYFAEGNTLDGFEQYVTVFNPGSIAANLTFHYMVEGQGEQVASGQVNPGSRATFKTRDQIGPGKNASLYLRSDQNVVTERPMYFNYQGSANFNWTGGHDVMGANSPAKDWYFAEGTTRSGFDEWLCLQNPGLSPVTINASYQLGTGQGGPVSKSYTVPAQQRLTISVNSEIGPEKDVSIQLKSPSGNFIAERPMYFNYQGKWTGGHDVMGTNIAATTWFFAEGTTRANFNEYLTIQNPGPTDACGTITYYNPSGWAIQKYFHVSASERLTVNVNDEIDDNLDISVKVSSDDPIMSPIISPIIVERPMYFNFNGWTGGHDVMGRRCIPRESPQKTVPVPES